jgi:hypothetical protein
VARKKQPDEVPPVQIVFRVSRDLHEALLTAGAGLGLDMSNLLRMILAEHVAEYIQRAKKAVAAREQARAYPQQAPAPEHELEAEQRKPAVKTGRNRRSVIID